VVGFVRRYSGVGGFMDWREMCTKRAEQCEQQAQQACDPQTQALYAMLAEQWRALANEPGPNPPGETGLALL
jgi:hypothetical protein